MGPDCATVPHVGPVEGKILQGADGRMYALEMIRLTPLDPNYVASSTGKFSFAMSFHRAELSFEYLRLLAVGIVLF